MPARILLSHVKALGFDFAEEVAKHRQDLADWAARPADWDPTPPPVPMHPLVATAVTVGTYELVDDMPAPPAPPALEERQHSLANAVKAAQAIAASSVVHPLKRGLVELRTRTATQTPWQNRTLGDREAINNHKGLQSRLHAIDLHAAEQIAAIADLTEETIAGWKMVPFPEAPAPTTSSLEAHKEQLAAEIDGETQEAYKRVAHPWKRDLVLLSYRRAIAVPEEKRTDGDKKAIAEHDLLQAKLGAVELHGAALKAEIAELGADALAAWKPRAFPES